MVDGREGAFVYEIFYMYFLVIILCLVYNLKNLKTFSKKTQIFPALV